MKVKLRISRLLLWTTSCLSVLINSSFAENPVEKQITSASHGHILTNTGVWSPDSTWITYDVRSDPAGDMFDGQRIERVNISSGKVQILFESRNQANCGVATTCPTDDRVVFIHGPENPDDDWQYAAFHRRGVIVHADKPDTDENLDARDIVAPFTSGALRGGSHVHTFSGDGKWVAFTYEDHVLSNVDSGTKQHDANQKYDENQRNVGVSVPVRSVVPKHSHPRNHAGSHFSVLVTRTTSNPHPGSDEITRAFSDAWIGTDGYLRTDGSRQKKAIAFQGNVLTQSGDTISEIFVVDLPEEVSKASEYGPLQGTPHQKPQPPKGTKQRRLTFTADRKHPGIQGVRHWLRSSPDGSKIAFLMKSDDGIAQLWTVSPNGGKAEQLTNNLQPISSAFSWSPDGKLIAHTMDGSVCVTLADSGQTIRLTETGRWPIRPEACVFSPDGTKIAYVRHVSKNGQAWNQIFVLDVQVALAKRS
ncbi:MAG: DUF3748 domain-containing protein [Planctomycetaceae bacterium]|nr:DUF3748 domain-containing protein [Planctomycetaceae bacterium]